MKHSKHFTFILWALIFAGCSASSKQIQKALEDNPDILVSAIKKNPVEVITALNDAARIAQSQARNSQRKKEENRMENEFKNPLKPKLSKDRVLWGKTNAPITIVKYSDFQCYYCAESSKTIKKLKADYGNKIRFIYKHLPLDFHQLAKPAAKVFEAVRLQSTKRAYRFYNELFANYKKIGEGGEKYLLTLAKKVGAKIPKVKKDMDSDKVQEILDRDKAEAEKFQFRGTPAYVINGVSVRGNLPIGKFKEIIDRHLKKK